MVHFRGLGPDTPYWEALSEGRLALPRCESCNTWHWPAVSRCGECGSWQQKWLDVPLVGHVFTWTRTWHAFGGAEGLRAPFVTAVVELPQAGRRRLLGLYDGDGDLKIGADVVGTVRNTTVSDGSLPAIHWRAP